MKPPPLAHSALSKRELPPEDRPEVAVMGRSNAGKSTLLNALVGARVAHVSQDPGRTRRIHFFDLGNWYLVDLPGYGFARVPAKVRAEFGQAVDHYLSTRGTLLAAVLIQDIRRDQEDEERMIVDWARQRSVQLMVVANKVDKLNRREREERLRRLDRQYGAPVYPVSAQRGTGLEPIRAVLGGLGLQGFAKPAGSDARA
jgi:GTP-binding protein